MDAKSPTALQGAIETIFAGNSPALHTNKVKPKRQTKAGADRVELALAVLLVDLASCDQNFDQREYRVITAGLHRMFGTSPDQVRALVNQAGLVLKNLRGVSRFGNILKEHLDEPAKATVLNIIEEIIAADGEEDGFETYLRNKFTKLLGMTDKVEDSPEGQQ